MTMIWGAARLVADRRTDSQGNGVIIDGRRFLSLHHRDGAFLRGGGHFAFSRRAPDGERTILHMERADDIAMIAGPGHPAWSDALSKGMNELLISLTD
ncbi:hypothetical protein [Caulobacter endophyticus]|uniref:hypothetical protein n=1 Tax=Caulobacter endophyticus TaxID=2172652 RepID=UPI0024100A3C|nr:hypothetical protein [Caulobacter endophyticus]MDG2528053.1 hypothetical protein [Caulobacter endophyticus]